MEQPSLTQRAMDQAELQELRELRDAILLVNVVRAARCANHDDIDCEITGKVMLHLYDRAKGLR